MLDIRRTCALMSLMTASCSICLAARQVERPALCCVSGSVAAVSRFSDVYSLDEVMPKTRSFVFSNRAGEITDMLQEGDLEEAMEMRSQYGGGSTDYGMSMMDLAEAT